MFSWCLSKNYINERKKYNSKNYLRNKKKKIIIIIDIDLYMKQLNIYSYESTKDNEKKFQN